MKLKEFLFYNCKISASEQNLASAGYLLKTESPPF